MKTLNDTARRASRESKTQKQVQIFFAPFLKATEDGFQVENPTPQAMRCLERLGIESQSWVMTSRADLASVGKLMPATSQRNLNTFSKNAVVPLLKLLEFAPVVAQANSMRPATVEIAAAGDALVLLPGVGRESASWLARSSRNAVLAVDSKAMDHAGPGSWSRTLRTMDALVITAEAAKLMTAQEGLSAAAQTLDNMSRSTLILVVSKNQLYVRARGQERRFEWPNEIQPDEILAALAAGVTACLMAGKSAEEIAHALVAVVDSQRESASQSLKTVAALQAHGEKMSADAEVSKRKQRESKQRTRQLVLTAGTAAFLLASFMSLTWLNLSVLASS